MILLRHARVRTELREHCGQVVAAADHRVLVRRPERDVAAPRLAAGTIQVGPVLDQQPQHLGSAAAPTAWAT